MPEKVAWNESPLAKMKLKDPESVAELPAICVKEPVLAKLTFPNGLTVPEPAAL